MACRMALWSPGANRGASACFLRCRPVSGPEDRPCPATLVCHDGLGIGRVSEGFAREKVFGKPQGDELAAGLHHRSGNLLWALETQLGVHHDPVQIAHDDMHGSQGIGVTPEVGRRTDFFSVHRELQVRCNDLAGQPGASEHVGLLHTQKRSHLNAGLTHLDQAELEVFAGILTLCFLNNA